MANKIRLDKYLSNSGYGSRKEIKKLLKNGSTKVDGQVVKDSSFKVEPGINTVMIDGNIIEYRKYVYIMMNKPAGVISATYDSREETVIDILEEYYKKFDLFPVGRLDKDTEGLLLLTNDGKLAHNLLSPKKHVDKTYYAEVDGEITLEDCVKFKDGVIIDNDYKTLPANMEIIKAGTISKVHITIREGKFHQIKKMIKAVGKKVIYLKRISMGSLKLDNDLEIGEYRELTGDEHSSLVNR